MIRHYIHSLKWLTVGAVLMFAAMPAMAQYGRSGDRHYRDRFAHSNSYGDVVEISLSSAGTLEEKMPDDMFDRVRILYIEGPLDVHDFKFIKKICNRSKCVNSKGDRVDNYLDLQLERARIMSAGGTGLFESRGERDVMGSSLNNSNHLRSIVLPERLKRIDDDAFRSCYNLEEVIMPPGVRSIGSEAFAGCSELKYIVLPEGLISIGDECFSDCSELSDVALPYSLTEIGNKAFEETNIRRISLPPSLTTIGKAAFNKTAITSLILPAGVQVTDDDFGSLPKLEDISVQNGSRYYSSEYGVLYDNTGKRLILFPAGRKGAFAIPDGVEIISNNAFKGCNLNNIECPISLNAIGDNAFAGCKNLNKFIIPEEVTSIGNGAFKGCSALAQAVVPASVAEIGERAFDGCSQLQGIDLPGIISLGKGAFASCSHLSTVTFGNNLKAIPQQVFENCSGLRAVELPATVASIGEKAFKGCKLLSNLTLHDGLGSIGKEAFRECTSLTTVEIPSSCTAIEKEAFRQCTAMTEIELGTGLRTLGDNALRETAIKTLVLPETITHVGKKVAEKCKSLIRLECHAVTPPTLGGVSNDKIELYVPAASIDDYKKTKNWKNFKRILPLN